VSSSQPPDAPAWRPSAPLATLRLRAELLAAARAFFAARQVLEVDTAALLHHAVTDVHLHNAQVSLPGHAAPLYLHTSPEYAMKRLLAAGSGDIYQIAHVYRGAERSRLHNPEFMLIEWYRCGFTLPQLMQEVAQLAGVLLGLDAGGAIDSVSYSEAFLRTLGCEPLQAADATLRVLAMRHGLAARLAQEAGRDELLDWLMGAVIGPRLGCDGLCFVHRYPASQASLACLDPEDARVALRFELYYRGIELANGFEELSAAAEQRARFEADRLQRRRRSLPVPDIDEALLAALAAGLPPVCGVALGFDRLLMLRTGATDIAQVLPFGFEFA
jgi:lysyl-tRNA synthetase class 2